MKKVISLAKTKGSQVVTLMGMNTKGEDKPVKAVIEFKNNQYTITTGGIKIQATEQSLLKLKLVVPKVK